MIFDHIDRCELYAASHKGFDKAFAFLLDYVENPKELGRYDIDGDNVYAMVSQCETKTEGVLEAHDNYIDIQFLDGDREKMEYANRDDLTVKVPYVEDIVFFEDGSDHSSLILRRHDFVIFYPRDAHKPGMAADKPISIKKVVVKVKA